MKLLVIAKKIKCSGTQCVVVIRKKIQSSTNMASTTVAARDDTGDAAIAVFHGPDVFGRAVFVRINDVATLVDIKLAIPARKNAPGERRLLGCHVHEYGNVQLGCKVEEGNMVLLGRHWNPDAQPHPRHAGDLVNNVKVNRHGNARVQYIDQNGLLASCARTILGRSVVVHAGTDDCGQRADNVESHKSGNAGHMLACAVIGRCTREFADALLDNDDEATLTVDEARRCPESPPKAAAAFGVGRGDAGLAARRRDGDVPCRNEIGVRPRK